jgi:uncharacterized Zn finger protein
VSDSRIVFVCTCPRCGGNVTQQIVSFTGGSPPPARCERCGETQMETMHTKPYPYGEKK